MEGVMLHDSKDFMGSTMTPNTPQVGLISEHLESRQKRLKLGQGQPLSQNLDQQKTHGTNKINYGM